MNTNDFLALIKEGDYIIQQSPYVDDVTLVPRTFFGRLLSLTPFRKNDIIYIPKAYQISSKVFLVSPRSYALILKELYD